MTKCHIKGKTCLTQKTLVMFPLESKRLGSTGQYNSYFHTPITALDVPPDRVRDSDESLHDLSGRDYR